MPVLEVLRFNGFISDENYASCLTVIVHVKTSELMNLVLN